MQFAGLRLNGFKSFVDSTELVIRPGLTGIVGPNGCGKSNLLEALRWVMGESRPTAMRGGGMEDVIFSGSHSRGARHFAEVTLFIDNADRLAPAGFNDADRIEILRRITRDLGSAYRANGREVRARDVQILFADAASGSLSPALVRQGQVAELVEARPAARRRILEDAAGIGGLHARRHEAELKLRATETNLARIGDTLEQFAAQMAALARQARQATRYREIAAQLRRAEALLLLYRWRMAGAAASEAEAVLRAAMVEASRAETALRERGEKRERAEAALAPLREEEAIAAVVVQRVTLERERLRDESARAEARIHGLRRRLTQIEADSAREAALNRDADETIARLAAEQAGIEQAHAGHDERLVAAARDMTAAGATLAAAEAALTRLTEEVAQLAARHQAATRQVADCLAICNRLGTAHAQAASMIAETGAALATAEASRTTAAGARDEAIEQCAEAEAAAIKAAARLVGLQKDEAAARTALGEASGQVSALAAESAALERMIARERQTEGQLLDRLTVDPGHEAALGAALGDDLLADEVAAGAGSGWITLAPYAAAQPLPQGAVPLSAHVRAPAALTRRLAQVGLVDAKAAATMQADLLPGQRLVTPDGDLWRWDGFCRRAGKGDSAATVHLQNVNRAAHLRHELDAARDVEAEARAAHESLREGVAQLAGAEVAARDSRRAADQHLAECERAFSRAEGEATLAVTRLEAAGQAARRHEEDAAAAESQLATAKAEAEALAPVDALRDQAGRQRLEVETARAALLSARTTHDGLHREGEAHEKRLRDIAGELAGWQRRLEAAASHGADLAARRQAAERELAAALDAPATIGDSLNRADKALAAAETRRKAAAAALESGETAAREAQLAEREATRAAAAAGEARAHAEARLEAAREALTAALAPIAALGPGATTPESLAGALGPEATQETDGKVLEDEMARLSRQREALGAVNLRAEEDAREIQTEHDALAHEQADLEAASAKLRSAIAGLNREGRARLLAAFEEVNVHFAALFTRLFGGGEARLALVDSDDPLQAGLEILCQPPGKRLSQLSLLSGGEQTLTALALIFGVFLANPAPICVLDEVDAALDDANVARLCDMLDEIAGRTGTRFLVITHHALTMARMDRLFGVTMQEQGVSQLVSVDLGEAEAMVA